MDAELKSANFPWLFNFYWGAGAAADWWNILVTHLVGAKAMNKSKVKGCNVWLLSGRTLKILKIWDENASFFYDSLLLMSFLGIWWAAYSPSAKYFQRLIQDMTNANNWKWILLKLFISLVLNLPTSPLPPLWLWTFLLEMDKNIYPSSPGDADFSLLLPVFCIKCWMFQCRSCLTAPKNCQLLPY